VAILDFKQAQDEARKGMVTRAKAAAGISGLYTTGQAVDDYMTFLADDGRSVAAIKDTPYRIEAFMAPPWAMWRLRHLRPNGCGSGAMSFQKRGHVYARKKGETRHNGKAHDGRARGPSNS
jgi:hypothetical protein